MKRYSLDLLVEASGLTEAALGRRVGLSGSSLTKARKMGLIESAADRYACRCGLLPWLVWSDWLEDAQVECAERSCTVRFVPTRKGHLFCSKRCCVRKQMQEFRARRAEDEAYLAMRRAEARAYYEECGDYVRARQRRYNARVSQQKRETAA